MSDIKRYDHLDGGHFGLHLSGDYVLWTDHVFKVAELEAELQQKITHHDELVAEVCKKFEAKDKKIAELDWLLEILNKYTVPGVCDTQDSLYKVLIEQREKIKELEHYIKIKELG